MPQGVVDEVKLWEILESRQNLMTKWPESRTLLDSFYDGSPKKANKLSGCGGHFINDDPSAFDAPFFTITAKEAAAMDPQQRWILETSYHAFENAGITLGSLKGSRTAVFEASMSDDYGNMFAKDPDTVPLMAATGCAASIRANRVSWHFGLLGPSMHVDTACSSSMVALDLACQSIRNGDASAALVVGCNLMISPEMSAQLSNQDFLSPDSVCWSFDHRANGYARGEGFIGIVLKPLINAIQDGDMIRAIVRSTGTNQDGHTPGLTQPSAELQEKLIRDTYRKAGLDFKSTRYIEAHGTGTRTGDPIEMKALGRVFRNYRSAHEPLYVGSIKSNIGHLEGASGLAGVVKAILTLERGIIAPNALFEKMNPDIDADFFHLMVPTETIPWPSDGLRRVSVNSFGMGGTNSHAILDDAFHFLQSQGFKGRHQCILPLVLEKGPPTTSVLSLTDEDDTVTTHYPNHEETSTGFVCIASHGNDTTANALSNGVPSASAPKLLVWTSTSENSIDPVIQNFQDYCRVNVFGIPGRLPQLAHQLAARRTHFAWRTYSIIDETANDIHAIKPSRASTSLQGLGFVFTGQGAQYAGMGVELMRYSVFRQALTFMDEVFTGLGCNWSLVDALRGQENINNPEYSQPLCTVLQIALVELLRSFDITPTAVVGHSSGEIAAAFATGALNMESACKIAFYRGKLAAKLAAAAKLSSSSSQVYAMMSVNLPEDRVQDYLENVESIEAGDITKGRIHLACVNSPINCTISGSEDAVDFIRSHLDKEGIFAQKFDTGGVAYHSPSMQSIAPEYLDLLRTFLGTASTTKNGNKSNIPMFSSVTGNVVSSRTLSMPQYWVDNLVSRVKFSEALSMLVSGKAKAVTDLRVRKDSIPITDLIEIGPHSALRRPIQDILQRHDAPVVVRQPIRGKGAHVRYHSALTRAKPALETIMELVGQLFVHGYPVSILGVNEYHHSQLHSNGKEANGNNVSETSQTPDILINLPKYPFDHSHKYWNESRLSRDYRLRRMAKLIPGASELLGRPAHDWNPLEPRWKSILSLESMPWLADHIVNETTILPGTAMLTMAIEAVRQHFTPISVAKNTSISSFYIEKCYFSNPIIVSEMSQDGTETVLQLRPLQSQYEKDSRRCEIKIFAYHNNARWTECCQCNISVQFHDVQVTEVDGNKEAKFEDERVRTCYRKWTASCTQSLDSKTFYEFLKSKVDVNYGESFRLLEDIRWDGDGHAAARIDMLISSPSPSPDRQVNRQVAAVFDAAVHLINAQISRGLAGIRHTLVLQGVSNMWLSAKVWGEPLTGSSNLKLSSKLVNENSKTGGAQSTVYGLADDDSVLLAMEKVDMAAVSLTEEAKSQKEDGRDKRLLHGIDWKPQLSLLSPGQLQNLLAGPLTTANDEMFMVDFFPKLESVMILAARRALRTYPLPQTSSPHNEKNSAGLGYLRKFVLTFEKRYMVQCSDDLRGNRGSVGYEEARIPFSDIPMKHDDFESLLQNCELERPSWQVFPVIARHLGSIMSGDTDPLDLVFSTGLAERFYMSLFDQVCDTRFRAFLELLCHENGGVRVLEAGAGTGAMTRHALSAFKSFETRTGTASFTEYMYTDISPSFFEEGRRRFGEYGDRVVFKTLDLEREHYEDQGFEPATYDIILLGAVLHATSNLTKTLQNLRRLLKPGGYLVFLEFVLPETSCGNLGFGVLPGWWLSTESWRSHGPLATEAQWDELLRDAGFSGNDLVLRDYTSDVCHLASIIVSKKVVDDTDQPRSLSTDSDAMVAHSHTALKAKLVLILDDQSDAQVRIADMVRNQYEIGENASQVVYWHELVQGGDTKVTTVAANDAIIVSLLEVGKHFLSKMSELDFYTLQTLLQGLRNLLWVTSTSTEDSEYPYYGAMTGFLRTMRSEAIERKIVTLSIEVSPSPIWKAALVGPYTSAYIKTVLEAAFIPAVGAPSSSWELEYIVRNGYICTGRAFEEAALNKKVRHLIAPSLMVEPWLPGPPLEVTLETPGALDTFQFVRDANHTISEDLEPGQVEIEARAWPLSFRDLFIAIGRLDWETPGSECAGIVTRIGPAATGTEYTESPNLGLRPGDRVCMGWVRSLRTHPRGPVSSVYKIPDEVSFESAASAFNPAMTAYHGLVNMARLQKGEKVLIHSAAGSTGQMAIWLAKMVGAEIFATVGYDFKKQLLVEEFNIPADHIFYSRDTSFAQGLKRMTNGVDVVLNSLSGEGLRASWECLAPYGRFVEIGKSDIMSNSSLPMANFARNVSFFAVDLFHMALHNVDVFRSLQRTVVDLLALGVLQYPRPLHLYPISDIEKAFRFLQSGKNTGRIVLTASPTDTVPKFICDEDVWKFETNASYLIVGGLGGLGRAIIRWMADRGAKYIIIPSRSGLSPSKKAASGVISALRSRGVQVVTPKCDASSITSLSTLIEECSKTMPIVKGCINASMALHDAVFENMSYSQWSSTIRSKINTSWNLHCLFPPRSLDFFILLSSLSGIYGSIAQSNYAAGCTFQDALARQRASKGERAVSFDIGWMRTIGVVAETKEYQRNRENSRDMAAIESEELLGLLNIYCNPSALPPRQGADENLHIKDLGTRHQVLIGAVTPADFQARGEPIPPIVQRPMFLGFLQTAESSYRRPSQGDMEARTEDQALLFRQANGPKERSEVVVHAIASRLARALSVSPDDVEPNKLLSDYGVDSLMAVELRNWIRRDFQANVAVFDIMGGITISGLGNMVVERAGVRV
ncbi:hypothetical protein F4819DRAFT_488127 [Hypoxylon fuscum]|nr:hypothetical protein F4819DRAFT_488127 [Hypoxylon fuscum]